ncbi:hypothetical protein ACP4OV_020705 [Aristida adscensionis]
MSSSTTRSPASTRRPQLRRSTAPLATVVISMALLSQLCIPLAADARTTTLHCHRKHRRHHRHHRTAASSDDGHIALPPAAQPPDVDGDPPADPPDVSDAPAPAPAPRSRHDKTPCPPSHPPSTAAPVGGAPRSTPASAKPPAASTPTKASYHSHAKPPSPSPAEPPTHPRAKAPSSLFPAMPPALSLAKPPSPPPSTPPSHSHAKPPTLPPAETPAAPRSTPPFFSPARLPSLAPRQAPAISFSPTKPPSSPPSHAKPPPRVPAPPQTRPPSLGPPPMPLVPSPSQPPVITPASPPAHAPARTPSAKPAPAQPPVPSPSQPPRLSPASPPAHAPARTPKPAPAQPPRLAPAKPPSPAQRPRLPPAKPPAAPKSPAKAPARPPATQKPIAPAPAPQSSKNGSAGCGSVFDVRAFGATGNGSLADDTRAFRAAWKAACSSASATLLVPTDGVFTIASTIFAGPCKPGLTFRIDGVLMPPDGPASWPASDSRRQWLVFYKADGMTLAGEGTVEGNGEEWWDLPCKPHRGPNGSTLPGPCDSPALIRFVASSDVAVRGLRIENSPQFHLKFDGCRRVRVDGLSVSSPATSPNTDGVHVENTTAVEILNSRIFNGDDCVSIGAGCSAVHVENVTCGHGHGISIGSLGVHGTRACVSNVTVRNARILDSDNGVRIKTWQGGAGAVSAVEFAGVQMRNVRNCIVIDQYYCLGAGCANQSSAVRVAGVAYRDIRGTYSPQAAAPIRLACSDAVACTDITMADVELLPAAAAGDDGGDVGAMLAEPYCWNAYGLMQTLTLPPVYCLQAGRPESLQDQLASC